MHAPNANANANADVAAAVDQLVRSRRSVRSFRPDPVDLLDVTRIVELTTMTPSAWNLQPWRFVVVADPATRLELQAAAFGQKQVGEAPVVVALYCDMVAALDRVDAALHPSMPADARAGYKANILNTFAAMPAEARDAWGTAQGNIALGYLLLLLEVHGYATSPMLGVHPPEVRRILGLPAHATIPALVAVGHAAGEPPGPPHRFPPADLIRHVPAAS